VNGEARFSRNNALHNPGAPERANLHRATERAEDSMDPSDELDHETTRLTKGGWAALLRPQRGRPECPHASWVGDLEP
jgi:hypothetical protein